MPDEPESADVVRQIVPAKPFEQQYSDRQGQVESTFRTLNELAVLRANHHQILDDDIVWLRGGDPNDPQLQQAKAEMNHAAKRTTGYMVEVIANEVHKRDDLDGLPEGLKAKFDDVSAIIDNKMDPGFNFAEKRREMIRAALNLPQDPWDNELDDLAKQMNGSTNAFSMLKARETGHKHPRNQVYQVPLITVPTGDPQNPSEQHRTTYSRGEARLFAKAVNDAQQAVELRINELADGPMTEPEELGIVEALETAEKLRSELPRDPSLERVEILEAATRARELNEKRMADAREAARARHQERVEALRAANSRLLESAKKEGQLSPPVEYLAGGWRQKLRMEERLPPDMHKEYAANKSAIGELESAFTEEGGRPDKRQKTEHEATDPGHGSATPLPVVPLDITKALTDLPSRTDFLQGRQREPQGRGD